MKVLSEFATMLAVSRHKLSIARFGRCELKLMLGKNALVQGHTPILEVSLHTIMRFPVDNLMVCIPRIFESMPPGKAVYYAEFRNPKLDLFDPTRVYGSTFISRRDAWVDIPPADEEDYWGMVRGIWRDRPVLLVCGSKKGLVAKESGFLAGATAVQHLQAPERDAWTDRGRILHEALAWCSAQVDPLVYLALGATATVLASELAMAGIQALDLGHMAQSWLRTGKQAKTAA